MMNEEAFGSSGLGFEGPEVFCVILGKELSFPYHQPRKSSKNEEPVVGLRVYRIRV